MTWTRRAWLQVAAGALAGILTRGPAKGLELVAAIPARDWRVEWPTSSTPIAAYGWSSPAELARHRSLEGVAEMLARAASRRLDELAREVLG